MKRTILLILLVGSFAATKADTYLTVAQLPDAGSYLPAPIDTTSQRFASDWIRYTWGKTQRTGERGSMARRDASLSIVTLANEFSGAFGMRISRANLPETYALLYKAMYDANNAVSKAKEKYMRKPPFAQFKEGTMIGASGDAAVAQQSSYVSAHASVGWAVALILSEINPSRQDTILHRGYEFGESRVISGYSYQTDVDAGRIAACGAVARLHADAAFEAQILKAKKEYDDKVTGVASVSAESGPESDSNYYNLQGVEVQQPGKGIFIHDGEKLILK